MQSTIDFIEPLSNENNSNHNGTGVHEEQACNVGATPLPIPPDLTTLSDGSRVEWVRDRANPSRIRLLTWRNGRLAVQDQFEDRHLVFHAPELRPRLATALCLPKDILPGGSPAERISESTAILRRYIHMAEQDYLLASSFLLSTWFPERVQVFPYLYVDGPTGSGKTPFLKLLSCFARRSILLGDITPAALYRIVDRALPTLLLDECELDGPGASIVMRRFLRVGNVPGELVARGDELFDGSCPKILCVNEAIEDGALSTRGIHIPLLPCSDRERPYLDGELLQRIAEEHQAKMLGFRLENIDRIGPPSEELVQRIEALSPKMRNIARALMIPLLGDTDLESQLMVALEEQDEYAVTDRSSEPAWFLVRALFANYHLPRAGEVTVGEIEQKVNRVRAEAGLGAVSARKVGAMLKTLGIKTRVLGSWGRGIELTPQFRRKVHELARQFGVTLPDVTNWMAVRGGYGGPFCRLCEDFGLTAELRFAPPLPERRHKNMRLFSPSGIDGDSGQKPTD